MSQKRKKQQSTIFFTVGKFAACGIIIFLMVSQLMTGRASKTAFSSMQKAVNKATDVTSMREGDAQMVRRLYGLDSTAFDGVELYYPKTNMGADELILIKMKSVEQGGDVKRALTARKTSQMNVFEGYAPAQYKTLSDSVVEVRGNYALFVSGKNAEAVKAAFLKMI